MNGSSLEMKTSEPYSPSARAKASADAGGDRGQDLRQHDAAEDDHRRGAERGRGLLGVAVEVEQHRLDRAHRERQRDEQQRDEQARSACRTGWARSGRRGRRAASMTMPATTVGSANGMSMTISSTREPRNGSRTSTQATSGAHDRADDGDGERQQQRQPQRGGGLAVGDRRPEARPAAAEGLADDRGQRQQHQDAQPEDDDAEARARTPNSAAARPARGAAPRTAAPAGVPRRRPSAARSSSRVTRTRRSWSRCRLVAEELVVDDLPAAERARW